MQPSPKTCAETKNALERFLCGRTLQETCRQLGYHPRKRAMLRDVLHGRWAHVGSETMNDLRSRLGLPCVPPTVPAYPCPTCGVIHGDGWDCGGNAVQLVRRRPKPQRLQELSVRELRRRIEQRTPFATE